MISAKTYAGIPDKYARLDRAEVVLISVPYDGTSTWQKGADKGFDAFLAASENMELYDIETNSEVYKKGIYIAETVDENTSAEHMVEQVHKTVKKYIEKNRKERQKLIRNMRLIEEFLLMEIEKTEKNTRKETENNVKK